jgi:Subtilase family
MPADQPKVLRHLDYSGRANPKRYTAKGGGGANFKRFERQDRQAHASGLRRELAQAQLESERLKISQELANYEEDAGITLTIRSAPGYPLKTESLDSPRFGISLLSVRQEAEASVTVATVFVKHGKLKRLVEQVEAYSRMKTRTDKSGKKIAADNADLIANIESIGVAAIEYFWTSKHPLPELDVVTWWEVWVRVGAESNRSRHESAVETEATRLGMILKTGKLKLPEHTVYLLKTTRRTLASAVALLNFVSELRHPALTAEFFIEHTPSDQHLWANDLKSRLTLPHEGAPAICVLDTGVNRGHPLLADLLHESTHDTVRQEWGKDDHYQNGHGTQMAGLAAYGDLTPLLESSEPLVATHWLESVKVLPRFGSTEPEHYGLITQDAISIAESNAGERQRVFAMAVTATDTKDFTEMGKPTAWSAALDSHTSGAMDDDDTKRLVCVSGGNAWQQNRAEYPSKNELTSLEDPAQSWNVLTVGACTAKDIVTDHNGDIISDAVCIAPRGGLSPHSATSCLWTKPESRHWPLKPDLVFEGGNVAANANGDRYERDSLCLLTTNSDIQQRLFAPFWATSAATALAANMAAQIQAEYPKFWPETVRALMVHSAEWTPEMLRGVKQGNKGDIAHVLRRFGHGQPNLARALASARSRATLICQDSLQPFEKKDGKLRTKDMMLYRLPWPKALLQANSAVNVRLRITLSYFIEPNPGSRMVNSKYRYAGCNLRFLVQTPTEKSVENFIARVSDALTDDERDAYEKPEDTTDGWTLGDDLRCRGSIHADNWTGTAAQLAAMEHLIVFPVNGWWRLRAQHKKYNNRIRYALVVSLETVGTDIDVFTPIEAAVLKPSVDVSTKV